MGKALQRKLDDMRRDVVPKGYPSPQTEVHTARDVGPHVPHQQSQQAARIPHDNVIEGEFHEVHSKQKGKGLTVSGEFAAIGREAIKDVRGTMMQVFFGQPEHPGEPGTPYNPTQQQVTDELEGKDAAKATPKPEVKPSDMEKGDDFER